MKFYEYLGVELKQHDYSYSFSTLNPARSDTPINTHMIYNGASGRAGMGLPSNAYRTNQFSGALNMATTLFNLIRWILTTLILALHYARLYVLSDPSSRTPTHLCRETLRAWASRTTQENAISRLLGWETFVQAVIVPLFSAVCTTSTDDIWEHPAAEILGEHPRFPGFDNHSHTLNLRLYLANLWDAPLCCRTWSSRYCVTNSLPHPAT